MDSRNPIRAQARALQALVGAVMLCLATSLVVGWAVATELGVVPGTAASCATFGAFAWLDARRGR